MLYQISSCAEINAPCLHDRPDGSAWFLFRKNREPDCESSIFEQRLDPEQDLLGEGFFDHALNI
jgi:hypothetical protein